MGNTMTPDRPVTWVQLILRGRGPESLVRSEADWRALGLIAARMLFWCGGYIHGCRCEGTEMRFAVEVHRAAIGAMAHHLSAAYAKRLRREHGWTGELFKHYVAIALDDDMFLDDLVLWLHRPSETDADGTTSAPLWTADSAYLVPQSSSWVTTDRVLNALSVGAPGAAAYRRRKAQPVAPETIALINRRKPVQKGSAAMQPSAGRRVTIEAIARAVADYSRVSLEEMRSRSRRRAVSKAKAIAAVLGTRNGATVAEAARFFHRGRSTLIEQVAHYRATQPQIFADAEAALAPMLEVSPR